jgi:hypothetical protein
MNAMQQSPKGFHPLKARPLVNSQPAEGARRRRLRAGVQPANQSTRPERPRNRRRGRRPAGVRSRRLKPITDAALHGRRKTLILKPGAVDDHYAAVISVAVVGFACVQRRRRAMLPRRGDRLRKGGLARIASLVFDAMTCASLGWSRLSPPDQKIGAALK